MTRIKGLGVRRRFPAFRRGRHYSAVRHSVQISIGRMLGLADRPTEKQLRELAEAWRPHRGTAAVLAWHSYNAVGTAL